MRHLADGDLYHNLLAKAVDVDVPPLVRGKGAFTLEVCFVLSLEMLYNFL